MYWGIFSLPMSDFINTKISYNSNKSLLYSTNTDSSDKLHDCFIIVLYPDIAALSTHVVTNETTSINTIAAITVICALNDIVLICDIVFICDIAAVSIISCLPDLTFLITAY